MKEDSEKVFQNLKKDISDYVELKLELLKLNTYERTGKVIAVLSYGLIMIFLLFFAILFIFLALSFLISEILGSASAGFAVVSLLYLVLIGIIVINRKRIRLKILNTVIAALTANEDKSDANKNSQSTTTNTSGEIIG